MSYGGEVRMDKNHDKRNEEFAKDLNLTQNYEREIDLKRYRKREELAEDLNFNRNQINHNRES